ncbi:DUF883 family protein [Orrella sp. 11846]|uniref:DUF883 family protein n=1 Tax=Orrella sp. 11846 TaxID=3409913 RepID=UPI003B59AF5E
MANKSSQKHLSDRLIDSVKTAIDDAEDLLRQAASETGDRAVQLRDQAMERLDRTRSAIRDMQDVVVDKGRQAAHATDDYVHTNPWQAVTISAVAGLLIGLLIGRR